ncbi:hypothetical protein [Arthrobacter sp. HLT1-21]
MTTPTVRQPQGIPIGGQFAATSHPETTLKLGPTAVPAGSAGDYRNASDFTDLEKAAEFFGHGVGFNSRTGNLELATGTASYTAMLEFQPYGNVIRSHNGEPVDTFPASLRKAQVLERFAANRYGDLTRAAAGAYVHQPGG